MSSRTPGSAAVSVPTNSMPDRAAAHRAAQPPVGLQAAPVPAGTGAARGSRALPARSEGKTAPRGGDIFFPERICDRDADDRPLEESRTGQRTHASRSHQGSEAT